MFLIIKQLHSKRFLITFSFQMMLQDLKNAVSQTFQKHFLERHLLFTRWFHKQITSICESKSFDLLFDLDFPQFSEKIPCLRFHTNWNTVHSGFPSKPKSRIISDFKIILWFNSYCYYLIITNNIITWVQEFHLQKQDPEFFRMA